MPGPGGVRRPCPQQGPPGSAAPGPGGWRGAAGRNGAGARGQPRAPRGSSKCGSRSRPPAAPSGQRRRRPALSTPRPGQPRGAGPVGRNLLFPGFFFFSGSSINLNFFPPRSAVSTGKSGIPGLGQAAAGARPRGGGPSSPIFLRFCWACGAPHLSSATTAAPANDSGGERGEREPGPGSEPSLAGLDRPEPPGAGPGPGAALGPGPGPGPRRTGGSGRRRGPSAARSQRNLRPAPPEGAEPPGPALPGGPRRWGSPSPRPLPVSPQIPKMSPPATGKCPNPP